MKNQKTRLVTRSPHKATEGQPAVAGCAIALHAPTQHSRDSWDTNAMLSSSGGGGGGQRGRKAGAKIRQIPPNPGGERGSQVLKEDGDTPQPKSLGLNGVQ